MSKKKGSKNEHVWIPDTQLRPGVPTNHLVAAGNYIVDKRPEVIVVGGDWWDLPSLNSYEKPGSKYFEGVSLKADIEFGNDAMADFLRPILAVKRSYKPRLVFIEGNHEYRLQRYIDTAPTAREGIISRAAFNTEGFEYHNFLNIVEIDGIMYSHYFCNPESLLRNVLGGQMANRLAKLKQSFTMGHQQTVLTGTAYLPTGRRIRGLVSGAFYQHDEAYAGPQGQNYWRGIHYKHEVVNGDYDLMEVSIGYLIREWL